MINEFFTINKKVIRTAFKTMILILFLLSLIICSILFSNGEITNLQDYILWIIGISFGGPVILMFPVLLKFSEEFRNNRSNFNSFPFSNLNKIGFKKITQNIDSKSKFVVELYRKEINGFIVDIFTDRLGEPKYLKCRFSLKPKTEDFEFKIEDFNYPNIVSGFSEVMTKYRHDKHNLNSIYELETELIAIANNLLKSRN